MSAILAIAGDWLRLVRDQKAFRILVGLALLFGALLIFIRIEPRSINLFFVVDISLDGLPGAKDGPRAPGNVLLHGILSFYVSTLPWVSYIVALLATSGVVPDLIRKGRIETLLARPITRLQVVLGSYLGGLLFVLLVGAILVAGSWTGLAVRGHFLSPAYLLSLLVIVAQYAIVYALALFFGLWLRSGAAAILLTFICWFLGSVAITFHAMRAALLEHNAPRPMAEAFENLLGGPAGPLFDGLYYVLPKVGELGHLSNRIFDAVIEPGLTRSIALSSEAEAFVREPDWWVTGGTSAGLVVVALALATRILARRDL